MKVHLASVLFLAAVTVGAAEPQPAAEAFAGRWLPKLKANTDYQATGGPQGTTAAAYVFRVVGPTYEQLWNHYADLCGIRERYAPQHLLNDGGQSAAGRYLTLNRPPGVIDDRKLIGPGQAMFLLQAEDHTATVTFHSSPDAKSLMGSVVVLTKP